MKEENDVAVFTPRKKLHPQVHLWSMPNPVKDFSKGQQVFWLAFQIILEENS